MSPRLTINETCKLFREAGIPMTNTNLIDGLVKGEYPFGRQLPSSGKRRNFEIWRKDVLAFIDTLKGEGTTCSAQGPMVNIPAVVPAPLPTKVAQVIKWATVCSNPRHQEADCMACPYRDRGLCEDLLLADAASVLTDMMLLANTCV